MDSTSALGFQDHDHASCIRSALRRADEHCATQGLRLTPIRRRVLELLVRQHRALGAYDILEMLRTEGHAAQPPVAYRALDFLVSHGFVHKIERLNAFIACAHPDDSHTPAFLICRKCDSVAEAQAHPDQGNFGRSARDAGFRIERAVYEAEGLCPGCQDEARP